MENEEFFGYYQANLPEHLEVRGGEDIFMIGVLIALSILFVSLAVRSNQRIPLVLPKLFLTAIQTDQKYKELMRISSSASLLLMLNYFTTSFILLFLGMNSKEILQGEGRIYFALAIPIGVFVLQIVPTYLIAFVSGGVLPLANTTANTFSGYQIMGAFFIILSVIWTLNPEMSNLMITLFILLVIISQVVRFVKNSYLLLVGGVSWYYLLLYLCTLEILPLFVAYYVFRLNFLS